MNTRAFLSVAAFAAALLLASCPANVFYGLEPAPNDSDGPDLVVVNPAEGQRVSGTLLVIGTASDKYAVSRIEVRVDDGSWLALAGTYGWSHVVDTTALSEGEHVINVRGTDKWGNQSLATRTIVVDQSVPSVSVEMDYENFQNWVRGADVVLSGDVEDNNGISQVQISFNGGLNWNAATLGAGETSWTYTIAQTATLPGVTGGNGYLQPIVRAIDDSGLIGVQSFPLYVDNTPPTVTITSPADDITIDSSEDLVNDRLVVVGVASDNTVSGITGKRSVRVNVGALAPVTTTDIAESYTVSVDVTSIKSNGPATITATVTDKAGNTGTATIYVSLDDTPPAFSGTVQTLEKGVLDGDLSKTNSNFGSGSFTLTGTVTDPDGSLASHISSIRITLVPSGGGTAVLDALVDNANADPLDDGKCDAGGAFSHALNTVPLGEGSYNLRLRVTDAVGGFATLSRAIIIDKTAPTVSIDEPAPFGLVAGTAVNIAGQAQGTGSEIESLRIRITDGTDDTLKVDTTYNAPAFTGLEFDEGYWSRGWDTTAFGTTVTRPDDEHTIRMDAVDLAGNTAYAEINVVKDPDAPIISFTAYSHPTNALYVDKVLLNGRYVNGSGTIKGTASDATQVDMVEVQVDSTGGTWTEIPITPGPSVNWSYVLPGLEEGSHVLYARVTDSSLATNTATISFVVDNTAPTIPTFSLALSDSSGTSYYHGIVNVSGTSADARAGIETVVVTVDEDVGGEDPEALVVTGRTSFAATWDTEALPTASGSPVVAQDGIAVAARVTDRAGNFVTSSTSADVRPYVISLSTDRASLGDAGIIVYGDNFSSTSIVTVGDPNFDANGNVNVTARNTASTPNAITFTVPGTWTPLEGLSSGPVLVKTGAVTNSAQTAVKMDLYHTTDVEADGAAKYPSAVFDRPLIPANAVMKVAYSWANGNNRLLQYKDGATERVILSQTSNPGYSFTSLAYSDAVQYVTYYASGGGTNHIRLAKSVNNFVGAEFTAKNISAGAGMYSSVKLDGSGNVHIVYFEGADTSLRYVKSANILSGDTLTSVTIDGAATDAGRWCSLAIDNDGNPNVVYYDATLGALKYARHDGTSWKTPVVIDPSNAGNFGNSIAIGGDNSIHVAYYDGNDGDLKYAYASAPGQAFQTITVDSLVISGWFPSIVVDGAYSPHIAYVDFTNKRAKYARKVTSAWKCVFVADDYDFDINNNSNYTSIAIDGSGRVHMIYTLNNAIPVFARMRDAIYLPED